MSFSAHAFDDDTSISDVHLKDESFLDINAHQFRKSLELKWLDTMNGWRAAGGSVSTDRLYFQNEIQLYRQLSSAVGFGMQLKQEVFYARKPAPLPLVSLDIYPSDTKDIGISVIGTPAYDKRQSDIGYAITFGRRPTNYLRLSWLKVDKFYNNKNEFDSSYYEEYGETWILEGNYRPGKSWNIYYDLKKDTPLDFVFDNQTSRFLHESYDYKVYLTYQMPANHTAGIIFRTMNVNKRIEETSSDTGQKIDYRLLDIFWIDSNPGGNREFTLGFRFDKFKENLQDNINLNNSFDFELTTWQAYSCLNKAYTLHQSWDMGLYLAWSERSRQYETISTNSFDNSGIQSKLRTSWQYHSSDKTSILLVSMSFNLDDLINDPGDGGGIYFQSRF